ncbi:MULTISPECIES: hypothetical protein [unclassified Streptomyces]|uniref:hypothetical protein n=1 Tax=unclassified Streptomyces TaxID=2593676 RepID=UPI003246F6A8
MFDAFVGEDSLEITLRMGRWRSDVVIVLSKLYHLSVDKGPEIGGSVVDAITLTHLPRMPRSWPDDAEAVRRFNDAGCHGLVPLSGPPMGGPAIPVTAWCAYRTATRAQGRVKPRASDSAVTASGTSGRNLGQDFG